MGAHSVGHGEGLIEGDHLRDLEAQGPSACLISTPHVYAIIEVPPHLCIPCQLERLVCLTLQAETCAPSRMRSL